MIRILAIDTSTGWGGAALLEDDGDPRVVAEAGLAVRDALAARLLPLIDALFVSAGWSRTSIDVYAAARGPGSFTGIRVGLGYLAGWGLASGRPCVGVGSLDALAEAYGPAEGERVTLLPAGRGNVYRGRFDARSSPPVPLAPPWAGAAERALEGEAPGVAIAPRGLLPQDAASRPGIRLAAAPSSIAAAVGRIAARRAAVGLTAADAPAALYVRPSYAEAASR